MYKVPFRDIVCDSIGSWIKECIWVFIIMKVFKNDIDAITPSREFYESAGYSYPKD